MRVVRRITVILGLFSACSVLFPDTSAAQDRRGGESRNDDDDDDNDGPPWQRGRNFGPPGGGPGGWGGPGGGGPRGGGWGGPGGGPPGGGWGGPGGGGWGGRRGGRDNSDGDSDGRRGRGGGGFGGFNPVEMFARQDRNGDGQIAFDELDERARGFMQRMAVNNGMSEAGPWKIDELRKSMEDRMRGGPGGGDRNDEDRERGDRNDSGSKAEAEKPLVPGFGAAALVGDNAPPLVPGFGIVKSPAKNGSAPSSAGGRASGPSERPRATASAPARSSSGTTATASSGGSSRAEDRARTMIKTKDANNDGKLQADEMEEMFVKPKDPNGDGTVTLEELTAQLGASKGEAGGEKSAERGGGERPRGGRGDRDDGDSGGDGGARRSFRFLTPKERLPKGIPDWFVDADDDGDGQIMMAEYAGRWTESKATEFTRRDKDGDGVITPREAVSGGATRDE